MDKHAPRTTQGFTLIESLVALVVLSIGLLGVAAMQLKALQSAHIGYQRSLVSLIATDGQERIWKHFAHNGFCPSGSDIASLDAEWFDHWKVVIGFIDRSAPQGLGTAMSLGNEPCVYIVDVAWGEARTGSRPEKCDEEDLVDGECEFEPEAVEMSYGFRLPDLG